MSCCVEDAVIVQLREIGCTIIRKENHFNGVRKCEDCLPYAVVKVVGASGRQTSDTRQFIHTVTVTAYFGSEASAFRYKAIVERWLLTPGCVPLVDCGCFCLRAVTGSQVTPAGGIYQFSVVFRGTYQANEESESEV
jgi:hypothetical protein